MRCSPGRSARRSCHCALQRSGGKLPIMRRAFLLILVSAAMAFQNTMAQTNAARFRLMTLDPGHFHASLVQKFMYTDVDPAVHVYAPDGDDLSEHLKRIASFNARTNEPTRWREEVYSEPDFFEKM